MHFKKELAARTAVIDQALLTCFDRKFDTPDIIISAIKYSLFAGGKRLRPVLMTETCSALGGDVNQVIPLACAIEMIHTYSLIHDDLPAMDNDDLRRGKPTNHKVYGENMAILAGDALLNYAMETALEGFPTNRHQGGYLRAFRYLARAAGINGMIGGQTGDILCEGDNEVTEEKLYYIHDHKTGALLKAAVLCGGYVAEMNETEAEALEIYSDRIGLAFQIVDDILDIKGDEKTLGKPVGSDAKNQKTTFVSLYGMQSSEEKIRELEKQALEALERIDKNTDFLKAVASYICRRDS